ncbi:MAG: class I SAM-dependent methyltransferase [Burkholderiales bacterium]
MSWDPVWEQVFSSQAWGRYPGEDLIRFVARNYYAVPDRASIRFLEVGCGTGTNLWFLAREGFSAHGIEGSVTAASIARERLTSECPGWDQSPRHGDVRIGDIMTLPWPDASFDALIDSEAVYCNDFDESCRIYREMHRVARPGGKLFVRTFATGTWGDGIGQKVGQRRFIADAGPLAGKGPSRFTTLEELSELLAPWEITETALISRGIDSQREQMREWIVQGIKR